MILLLLSQKPCGAILKRRLESPSRLIDEDHDSSYKLHAAHHISYILLLSFPDLFEKTSRPLGKYLIAASKRHR